MIKPQYKHYLGKDGEAFIFRVDNKIYKVVPGTMVKVFRDSSGAMDFEVWDKVNLINKGHEYCVRRHDEGYYIEEKV